MDGTLLLFALLDTKLVYPKRINSKNMDKTERKSSTDFPL